MTHIYSTTDVADKINSDNTSYEASIVTMADKIGNVKKINSTINIAVPVTTIETKYTDRFDNPTYY